MRKSRPPSTGADHRSALPRRRSSPCHSLPGLVLLAAAAAGPAQAAQAAVTTPRRSPVLPEARALEAIPLPGSVLHAQETGADGQLPDTLQVLLARVLALEAAGDSASARLAELQEELTRLGEESARERRLRADELQELQRSLVLLLDSASASTASALVTRLDAGLGAVRGEGRTGRGALHAEVGGVGLKLGELKSRVDDWTAAVSDSLDAARGRFVEEQGERRSGDRRNAMQAGIAAGLLLFGVGAVWWYGRSKVARLDGRIRRFQPEMADRIEKARDEIAAGVREESGKVLREQLESLETLTGMLGSIRAMKAADPSGPPEPDHDLPLAVCNVVNRIERNLVAMGSGVRGYKQLMRCVRDVKQGLRDHDYEMIDLLGRPYDRGMHLEPDFVSDDRLAAGERTVTQVDRPEVRYRGAIVQSASVKVAVGP